MGGSYGSDWAMGRRLGGDKKPATIEDTSTGFDQQKIEAIAATNPTKIIAVNHAIDDETKKKLTSIAPTTVHSEEDKDWQIPWENRWKQSPKLWTRKTRAKS